MRVVILLLLAFPVAAADAGTTPSGAMPVDLYLHVDDFRDMPMVTVPPPADHVADVPRGLMTHSAGCVDAPMMGAFHIWYAYLGAEAPAYTDEGHGITRGGPIADVVLDATALATLTWLLETQANGHNMTEPLAAAPLVVPDVVVRATVREGSGISVGDAAYNVGRVVAQGETAAATLSPDIDHAQVTHHMHGDRHVYRFEVPLAYEDAWLAGDLGMNVRIDVFVANDACEDAMPDLVRPHSSPDLRPVLTWTAIDALRFGRLEPEPGDEGWLFHATLSDAWGAYDIDQDTIRLTVIDENGRTWSPELVAYDDFGHGHGDYGPRPADMTFGWHDATGAGWHQVTASACALDGRACASAQAAFHPDGHVEGVLDGEAFEEHAAVRESAAVPILALVLVVGLAFLRRRP